jgi:hypothetical protein
MAKTNLDPYLEALDAALASGDDDFADEIKRDIKKIIAKDAVPEWSSPLLTGIGSGMNRVGQDIYGLGVGAGEMMGIADEGAFTDYRDEVGRERSMMDPLKEQDWTASAGEVVGEIAATLPFGGVTGITAKQVPNAFARGVGNVGIGMTQGALGSDDPLEGAMWGAGGSVIGEGLGEIGRVLGKGEMPNIPHIMEEVPVMRADDTGSIYGSLEKAAEFIPSGRNAVVTARQKQQEELGKGMSRLVDEYDEGLGSSAVMESFNNRMKARKEKAGLLYDDVAAEMEGKGAVGDWKNDIVQMIDKLKADPVQLQDKALIDKLNDYITGNELPDWDELRRLRSIIGRDISDTYQGGSLVGSTDTGALLEAKGAVTRSLDTSAEGIGPAWREADSYYRDEVAGPYSRSPSIVKEIMNVQSPEEMVKKILQPKVANNPTLVNEVMNALDEPGKAALRSSMLREAFGETIDSEVSPAKAAAFIHKREKLFSQIFPSENIGDLIAFLRHIKGAGQFGNIPPTGMGAEIGKGVLPSTSLMGAGSLLGGMDLAMTGGVMAATLTVPMITGRLLAAAATGRPGALGKVMKEMGQVTEPVGRLSGAGMPTDD